MDDICQIPYGQPTKMSTYTPEMLLQQETVKAVIKPNSGSVKVSFKCPAHYKKEFKDSHCLLLISVGQKAHEGEIFLSTVRLINSTFKECTILVADSLQRHTLMIGDNINEKTAYQLSMIDGDLWLEKNQKFFDEWAIPYNIVRWDHWLEHTEYSQQLQAINILYEMDEEIKAAFHLDISEFIARYQKRVAENISFHHKKAFSLCFDYLKEECSVMYLLAQAGYVFEIYPRSRNLAMSAIYTHLVEPYYPGMLKPISLSMKI